MEPVPILADREKLMDFFPKMNPDINFALYSKGRREARYKVKVNISLFDSEDKKEYPLSQGCETYMGFDLDSSEGNGGILIRSVDRNLVKIMIKEYEKKPEYNCDAQIYNVIYHISVDRKDQKDQKSQKGAFFDKKLRMTIIIGETEVILKHYLGLEEFRELKASSQEFSNFVDHCINQKISVKWNIHHDKYVSQLLK